MIRRILPREGVLRLSGVQVLLGGLGAAGWAEDEGGGVLADEHPEPPPAGGLAGGLDEDLPSGLIRFQEAGGRIAGADGAIERLQKGDDALHDAGQGAVGKSEALQAKISPDPVHGHGQQILEHEQLDDEVHREQALFDQLGRRRGGDDPGSIRTFAGLAVAEAPGDPALQPHYPIDLFGWLRDGEKIERQAAPRAMLLVFGKIPDLLDCGKLGMSAPPVAGRSTPLSPAGRALCAVARRITGGGRFLLRLILGGGGLFLRLAAKDPVRQVLHLGCQRLDLSLQIGDQPGLPSVLGQKF